VRRRVRRKNKKETERKEMGGSSKKTFRYQRWNLPARDEEELSTEEQLI